MVSITFTSFCHKSWQFWDVSSQCEAHLCSPIACVGSDWHGIDMPTCQPTGSSYQLKEPFGPWQASDLNSPFMLHKGSVIDAYGRLMKVLRWTLVASVGDPLHCFSSSITDSQSTTITSNRLKIFSLNLFWWSLYVTHIFLSWNFALLLFSIKAMAI